MAIRPIKPADFEFISTIASKTPGFTVPSPYVLWMLARFHHDWSVVATKGGKHLAYMLAFPAGQSTIFVWQFVCTSVGKRSGAAGALAAYLKSLATERKYRTIIFTTVPQTATQRVLQALVRKVFKATIHKQTKLPKNVSSQEWEYLLEIPRSSRSSHTRGWVSVDSSFRRPSKV